jgi:hypothetical protein
VDDMNHTTLNYLKKNPFQPHWLLKITNCIVVKEAVWPVVNSVSIICPGDSRTKIKVRNNQSTDRNSKFEFSGNERERLATMLRHSILSNGYRW